MNSLYRSLILSCMVLLAACSNEQQGQAPAQSNTPQPGMPLVAAPNQPAEPVLVEARPALAEAKPELPEAMPALADEEMRRARVREEAEPSVAAPAVPMISEKQVDTMAAPKAGKMAGGNLYRAPVSPPPVSPYMQGGMPDREQYGHIVENPAKRVAESPVSTFSIDVDTGSYANVRRMLNAGRLPPADAVRVEEMINYFPYAYDLPRGNAPFAVYTEIAPAPWNHNHHLLRIGIKGQDVAKNSLPPANLVFLVDVSGSMMPPERLPLLKSALKLLVRQLRPQDRVSLVTYASGTQVVLEPTSGAQKRRIMAALDNLQAGGSTNGAGGIVLAYRMAEQGYINGGINRILLATDGDFNVGITSFDALKNMVEEKRRGGVSLSTLGFGVGNYNEKLMEQLADAGNGNYSYIDTLNEGQKVLVNEMTSTLATIAKDVKIQIEFNPTVVSEYRLVGYENRMLKREDFNNDKVDAGEVGAGHTVTAIYELTLKGDAGSVDPLRYGNEPESATGKSGELAFLRLRYKAPDGDVSRLAEWPLHRQDVKSSFAEATPEFRFAAAVAAFGQQLRGGKYIREMGYAETARIAAESRGADTFGYRGEFVRLVNLAASLSTGQPEVGPID